MKNNWEVTASELMNILRGSLMALVPWLERAHIKWNEEYSYDDWDNIVKVLYENIICSSVAGEVRSEYNMAKFGFYYNDYSKCDYIRIKEKHNNKKNSIFVSFITNLTPFDQVKVAHVDQDEKVLNYSIVNYEELEFEILTKENGSQKVIDRLNVVL